MPESFRPPPDIDNLNTSGKIPGTIERRYQPGAWASQAERVTEIRYRPENLTWVMPA